MAWFVKVMAFGADSGGKDELAHKIGPFATERQADKADRGVNINLNHDAFYTLVEEDSEETQ